MSQSAAEKLPPHTGSSPAGVLPPDTYWTDEHRLFRVVRTVRLVTRELVELEDCVSLELILVSTDQLARAGLRPVAAAA